MNALDPVLLVLLGWALGLFTPKVTDAIRRPYRVRALRGALVAELLELQHTMVAAAFGANVHLGTLDRELLQWAIPLYERYTGPGMEPRVLEGLRTFNALPPAEFQAVVQAQQARPGRGLNLKTYDLPFLSSQLQNLSVLPVAFLRALYRVRSRLNNFNEDVRFLMQQHQLTFAPGLSPGNYQVVVSTIDEGYRKLGRLARSIADDIEDAVG